MTGRFWVWVHGILFWVWVALAVWTLVSDLKSSVPWLMAISLYTTVFQHAGAWQAARVERLEENRKGG